MEKIIEASMQHHEIDDPNLDQQKTYYQLLQSDGLIPQMQVT